MIKKTAKIVKNDGKIDKKGKKGVFMRNFFNKLNRKINFSLTWGGEVSEKL